MLAITWNFAMVARVERYRSAIPVHGDLAAQNHDAHIEVAVRMHIFGEVGLLTAMNDFETLAPQIAFERLARERPAVAAAAGQIGDALRANLLGMHAAGGHLAALSGTEVSGLLSRVMVISPPRTNSRASKSWQWLVSLMFGRKLAKTARKPSRRRSASNSVLSIASTPCLANPSCAL